MLNADNFPRRSGMVERILQFGGCVRRPSLEEEARGWKGEQQEISWSRRKSWRPPFNSCSPSRRATLLARFVYLTNKASVH